MMKYQLSPNTVTKNKQYKLSCLFKYRVAQDLNCQSKKTFLKNRT